MKYDRLNDFNGQFSIDYPKGWQFTSLDLMDVQGQWSDFMMSTNGWIWAQATELQGTGVLNIAPKRSEKGAIYKDGINYGLYARFTGSIDKDDVIIDVISTPVDYKDVRDDLLSDSMWSDKAVVKCATLKNNTVFSVFSRQSGSIFEFLCICGIGEGKTVTMAAIMDIKSGKYKNTRKLAEYCKHMIDSLQDSTISK